MSLVPLDFQRRCERRWAARFSQPVEPVASRKQGSERKGQQVAGPDKGQKEKPAGENRRPVPDSEARPSSR